MPKVSVIIPVYNVEKYLKQCLDSVVNQTLKDIDIILVDDGSTDSSLFICNEYAKKDSRITVLQQDHKGAGAARNKGINKSNSEFVIFCDSDDFYPEKDILECLYNNAKKHNVYICGGSFSELNNDKLISQYENTFDGYIFKEEGIVNYKDYQFDYGYHRFIYNRQFLKDNNIYFPDYKRFQDPPFFVKAMYKAKEFYAIAKTTYLFRCGHKTIDWTIDKKMGLLNGIQDNLNFAKKHKLEKLYYLTCERLNQHGYALNSLESQNTFLLYRKLLNIIFNLDWKILKRCNANFKLDKKYNLIRIFYQNIFSLRTFKNRKIITVLGIRIKVRRENNNA